MTIHAMNELLSRAERVAAFQNHGYCRMQLGLGALPPDADDPDPVARHRNWVRQFNDAVAYLESAWGRAVVTTPADTAHPTWDRFDRAATWQRYGRTMYMALDCPDGESLAYLRLWRS